MEVRNHLLYDEKGRQVTYKSTPNRGGIYVPQYLIIHYDAAANSTSAVNWMLSPKSKVSAHLHIDRSGNVIQLAPFNIVCWHAGQSYWKGLTGLNQYSIGIELQNTGTQEYTPIQLQIAQEVAAALVRYYQLKDILGHSDIAPGRKIDPGKQFPMVQFRLASGVAGNVQIKRTSGTLNLRTGAGTSFPIIIELPKGTEVNIIAESGQWVKVFVCSLKVQGFVNKSYLI